MVAAPDTHGFIDLIDFPSIRITDMLIESLCASYRETGGVWDGEAELLSINT